MKLIPVDPAINTHPLALYKLLEERPAYANISHREMPTWEQHLAFVERMSPKPRSGQFDISELTPEPRLGEPRYQAWYLVTEDDSRILGDIYLTSRNEIGVAIFKAEAGMGYGPMAVRALIEKFGPAKFLANVAPNNEPSRKMFEKLGFKLVQVTYALEAE